MLTGEYWWCLSFLLDKSRIKIIIAVSSSLIIVKLIVNDFTKINSIDICTSLGWNRGIMKIGINIVISHCSMNITVLQMEKTMEK